MQTLGPNAHSFPILILFLHTTIQFLLKKVWFPIFIFPSIIEIEVFGKKEILSPEVKAPFSIKTFEFLYSFKTPSKFIFFMYLSFKNVVFKMYLQ